MNKNSHDLMKAATEASRVMKAAWPVVDSHDDRREFHCEHGTYTGHPSGADLMCGWCEDGIPADEWSVMMREAQLCDALNTLINAAVGSTTQWSLQQWSSTKEKK